MVMQSETSNQSDTTPKTTPIPEISEKTKTNKKYENLWQSLGVLCLGWPLALTLTGLFVGVSWSMGVFSLELIFIGFILTNAIISGLSYLFRLPDLYHKHGKLPNEAKAALAGASFGLGMSIAGSVLGLPVPHSPTLGKVGAETAGYLANVGGWAGLFFRAHGGDRPKWERWTLRFTVVSSLVVSSLLVGLGYDLNRFLGIPGLGLSANAIGAMPANVLFIGLFTIFCASFMEYAYRGLMGVLKVTDTDFVKEGKLEECRDAAKGVSFGLFSSALLLGLSVATPVIPMITIPAMAFLTMRMGSAGGGLFSRTGRTIRCLQGLNAEDTRSSQQLPKTSSPTNTNTKTSDSFAQISKALQNPDSDQPQTTQVIAATQLKESQVKESIAPAEEVSKDNKDISPAPTISTISDTPGIIFHRPSSRIDPQPETTDNSRTDNQPRVRTA